MQLPELLQDLGYQGNPNFLTGKELGVDPEHAHVYRRAQTEVAAGGCSLRGVYRLSSEPFDGSAQSVPLVYVCEAGTEADADAIHRRVWNQSIVPFLIVSSPKFIRLYSGFRYESPHSDRSLLLRQASSILGAFRASAIDEGRIWSEWGHAVTPDTRVDWKLLKNLQDLDGQLLSAGVSDRNTSHALIGKFVYLTYLRHRKILSDRKLRDWGLDPQAIFGRHATLQAFSELLRHVQEWLNGEIFPIPQSSHSSVREDHIQLLAATFYGDQPGRGQLSLFEAYDFSFIPIETLSVIYEQFLHFQSTSDDHGAFYTPLPVVSFMVEKLAERKPLQVGTRVFDPSCGSGAFLVYAYRKLIEKQIAQNKGVVPKLSELRELLVRHIFGVDIDSDACSVAELSLILTLLDYAHPPDLSTTSFQLPSLRGRNIFNGDFFDDSGPWMRGGGYDWVIGNPPWVETRARSIAPQYDRVHKWMLANKSARPTGGNQVAEAFTWRAADVVSPHGVAALLMPAMTLFKRESQQYRRAFFQRNDLWAVANFSNLAEVLFAGRSWVPAATICFSNTRGSAEIAPYRESVEVYSPLVANALSHSPGTRRARQETWNLIVDSSELKDIPYRRIADGESLAWKLAAWGSEGDRKILCSVERRFPCLGDLEQQSRITISEGLQLRTYDSKEPVEHHPELAGKPLLDMAVLRGRRHLYQVPSEALRPISESRAYVREGRYDRPAAVCQPPHVIVNAGRTLAMFSDEFVAIPPRQIGIASNVSGEGLLKALSLFLSSDFVKYHQFFHSSQGGVKRERTNLADLRRLPVPFAGAGPNELSRWADLHTRFRDASNQPFSSRDGAEFDPLLLELNRMADDALGLSPVERARVHDLVHVKLELRDGKTGKAAVAVPSSDDLESYANMLRGQLDAFLDGADSMWHQLAIVPGSSHGLVEIDLKEGVKPDRTTHVHSFRSGAQSEFLPLPETIVERRSQWMYFQRNLRIYDGTKTYLFKPMQRFHWTQTQALDDAVDIIAETLMSGSE